MFYRGAIYWGVDWWLFAEVTGTLLASIFGIAAVWVALGKSHWFFRTCVAAVLISAWVLVPAYDVCLAALVQYVIVIAPLLIWRFLRGPPEKSDRAVSGASTQPACGRYQFALRDLLLLTVLAAGLCALLVQVPKTVWYLWSPILYYAIGFGIVTLVATWAALGRRLPWLRIALVCVVPYAIPTAAWLAMWRRWKASAHPVVASRSHWLWASALGFTSLCIFLPPVWVYTVLVPKAPLCYEEMPEPNAYQELVDAGKPAYRIVYPLQSGYAWLNTTVKATAPAVAKARLAMQKPLPVPVAYDLPAGIDEVNDRIHAFEGLAGAFITEGKLAELEGRIDDALGSYRDVFLLARRQSQGGLYYDLIFVGSSELWAMKEVHELRHRLTAQQCRAWIQLLHEQERVSEPPIKATDRHRAWVDRALGWEDRLRLRLRETIGSPQIGFRSAARIYRYHLAAKRLLACELALCLYSADHRRWPERLEQLVPEHLSAVPLDPFGGRPLIYRRYGDGYVLYSVGPDEVDNGGALPQFNRRLRDFESGDFGPEYVFRK